MMPNILSVTEHIADALGHGVDDEAGEWCDHRWSHVLHPDATDWRSELLERIKSRSDWPGDGTREREGLESKLDEQLSMEGLNFLRGRAQQLMNMYWDDPDKLSFIDEEVDHFSDLWLEVVVLDSLVEHIVDSDIDPKFSWESFYGRGMPERAAQLPLSDAPPTEAELELGIGEASQSNRVTG